MKSAAEAFLQAATHAPQPMHCAASIAARRSPSAIENGVAVRRAADVHRRVAAGLDDAVERAAIDDEVLDDGERLGAPRLERDACRRP